MTLAALMIVIGIAGVLLSWAFALTAMPRLVPLMAGLFLATLLLGLLASASETAEVLGYAKVADASEMAAALRRGLAEALKSLGPALVLGVLQVPGFAVGLFRGARVRQRSVGATAAGEAKAA